MTRANLLSIPKTITPGDTVTWRDRFIVWSPHDYVLTWAIRGSTALDLVANGDGEEFVTVINQSESSTLISGRYFYQAYITDNVVGDRTTVGGGQITVGANLQTTAHSYDGSTLAAKMLAAVEAAIKARLEGGAVDSYEIRGRNLSRTPLPDLVALRSQLRIEVAREQSAAGLIPDFRRLHIRFGSPQ